MYDILRALSVRFYLSLVCAVIVIVGCLSGAFMLKLFLNALVGTLVILFVFVPLLFLLLGLFYRGFGYLRPTPPWRDTNLTFPVPVTVSRVGEEQPTWAAQAKSQNSGTLARFIEQHEATDDDTELRIGIILAGGGAKGVYQAGALRALWEFLEREDALKYVRVVTGTSIGSWNAMFWLTDLVKDNSHRDWWASAAPYKLVGPTFY
ncbi:MAG: patatin-like phospholipase family protein, partial [Dehalococcoidia bacterium]